VVSLTLGCAWFLQTPIAQAATGIPIPVLTVVPLPSTWSALGTGTLSSVDIAAGTGALVGTEVKAQVGTVDFAGTPGPGTYTASWLSCPTRGAAESMCVAAQAGVAQPGNPSGQSLAYTPKPDDVGRFLRFAISVVPSGTAARTATSDPAKDVYVIGPSATGAQPELKAGQVPGENGIALLKKWTIPAGSTFRSREAAVWACTSSTAGQTAARDFAPSSAGCTSLPLLTSVSWVADPTAIVFSIPADATGKYLLVSDAVTTATGPSLSLATYVVRSAAVPLKGAASAPGTPSPSPSPTPSSSATTNSGAGVANNPSGAVVPTMSVTAERRVSKAGRYTVTVSVNPATSTGIANVSLVTRNAKARTVQTLSSVQVANGTGTSQSTITAAPGRYALMVQFVDTKTGKSLTYSKKVRVRP